MHLPIYPHSSFQPPEKMRDNQQRPKEKNYDLFSTVTTKNLILEIRVPTHL